MKDFFPRGQIKKIKALYMSIIMCHYFFDLNYVRGLARYPSKNLVRSWGDLKTPKFPSEINLPLVCAYSAAKSSG